MSATQTYSEPSKSLSGLLPIFNRWKYLVLGLTLLAAVLSTVISLTLPNEYSSTTVFYPTNLRTIDPDRIFQGQKVEVTGATEDIDRVITIGQSRPLAEYIVKKFKLYTDYGYTDINDDESRQGVLDEFSSNLNIIHNQRDAIELTFLSTDKEKAALVANEIVKQIDLMNQQLTMENREKVLDIYENRQKVMAEQLNLAKAELDKGRRQYGIYGLDRESRYLGKNIIETQTELVKAKGELDALQKSGGAEARINTLKAEINGLEKAYVALTKATNGNLHNLESYAAGVEVVNQLYAQYNDLLNRYISSKKEFEDAKIALTGKISSVYLVQKAYPAMRKAKPVRSVIVIVSTMLTLVLATAFVALYELYKREAYRFGS